MSPAHTRSPPPSFILPAPILRPRPCLQSPSTTTTTTTNPRNPTSASTAAPSSHTYDIVVVGAGLGGLSAAALLSACYSKSVCVLEAHTVPGGAAHEFQRKTSKGTFTFDVGPHLFSGLSSGGRSAANPDALATDSLSANPMQHVLRAVDAQLPVIPYKRWGVLLPDNVYVPTTVSPSEPLFSELVSKVSGAEAREQVATLLHAMRPLCRAATALPPAAIRVDDFFGTLRVASRFLARPDLISTIPQLPSLTAPFASILHRHVKDPFARNFINLLCFLLAGVTAEKIPTAEVAFMFSEWTGTTAGSAQSDMVLEHPVGGAAGIVRALVEATERSPHSRVRTSARVAEILLENDKSVKSGRRAVGVKLKSGESIFAREGVITNVSCWDLPSLFSDVSQGVSSTLPAQPPMCPSFMHLHLAVELTTDVLAKMPHPLEANYASVEDWSRDITSPDNVVLVSIPTVLEPERAPHGFAIIHAYTPATEPYGPWASLKPGTPEYEALKRTQSAVLWRAVERIFGQDVRELAHVKLIGTPRTHERFLNRKFGTYGPEVDASKSFLTLPFPRRTVTADRLWSVGDSTFPGIGVPATAASAWLAANSIANVDDHAAVLRNIGL